MASFFQLIAALIMAFFAARNDCQAFTICNITLERQPKESVEVYKLTIPRQILNEQRGTDSNRQTHSSKRQTYEILVKPREHKAQDVPGNRQITLVIESNGNGNRQSFQNPSMHDMHIRSKDPTPLSVKTISPNIETFQQKKSEKNNVTDTPELIKKKANEFRFLSNGRVNEKSEHVQTPSDVKGRHSDTQQQIKENERKNGNGFLEETTAGQKLFHNQYRQRDRGNSEFDQRTASEFNYYKTTTEENFPRPVFQKHLVYESDYGISSQLSIVESPQPRTPVQNQTDETSWTVSKSSPARDDIRGDRTESWVGTSPAKTFRESHRPISNKRTTPDYSVPGNDGNHQGRPEEKYFSNTRKIYSFNRDPENQDTGSRLPYQQVDDQRDRRSTILPPTPTNAYFGFPESFTKNMQESSRVSSSDINRPLPSSPCPSILKYTLHEEDRWYADIYVSTDEVLTGMRLDIDLSKSADIMTADIADVKSYDNNRFTVLSLKRKLVPGPPETVRIMVKYNEEDPPAPVVRAIRLNGRLTCPLRMSMTPKSTTRRPAFPVDIEEQKIGNSKNPDPLFINSPNSPSGFLSTTRRTPPRPHSNSERTTILNNYASSANPDQFELWTPSRPTTRPNVDRPGTGGTAQKIIQCGKPAVQPQPLITNGQVTSRGQWPWHVGLYKNIGPNLSYSCGGSLITDKHVITAAHCVTKEYSSVALDPKVFLVYLGKYHLYVWTEYGIMNREVSRVTVHPNYNGTSFRSDLAVLTLSNKVEFTDFIRPVCLWDGRNTKIEDIVGIEGTVIGWGIDESKHLTKELRQAKMPVVADNVCLRSYPEFFPKFTSNTTYCAGYKNGTSVCNGDSGGGMFFPIWVDKEERWYLRGLVSLSPSEKEDRVCDTKHYIIFTDVAKYLPWLADVLF